MLNTVKKQVKGLNKSFQSTQTVDDALEQFDKILEGYGVEAIRRDGQWHRFYGDIAALYVNLGDSYQQTVFYDTIKQRFFVADHEQACKRLKI